MKMLEVEAMLKDLRAAREAWGKGRTEFFAGYNVVLRRLVLEGLSNYMGATQIASALGVSPGTIRKLMRSMDLDPKGGKRALNARASEAMLNNAALLGIEPSQMDLTSPLAYLPMGADLKRKLQEAQTSRVTEIESGVSGNDDLLILGSLMRRFLLSEDPYVSVEGTDLVLDGHLWDLTPDEIAVVNPLIASRREA